MGSDTVESLKGVSFFQNLSPASLEAVAERTIRRRVPAGTILSVEGLECAAQGESSSLPVLR